VTESWFALHVKPKQEFNVAAMLRAKGYEEFLPVARSGRDGKPRLLFSSYVFCRLSPDICGRFITTPGVIRIVGFGGRPAPVDPDEIAALKIVKESNCSATALAGLHVGDRIIIEGGPLRGVCGVLSSIRGQHRFLISVTIMMRTVAVEIKPEWIGRAELATRPVSCDSIWLPQSIEAGNPQIRKIA
jgi:transcriptional antiterminator RfaH